MSRKGTILGILLIILGIGFFLNNFIVSKSYATILIGLFILYLFYKKRQSAFLIIGLFLAGMGLLSVLNDLNIFTFKVKGELILILLGVMFITLYYSKKNIGFLFPGAILISLGSYIYLINFYNRQDLWPCFFILLGLAFYFIYFAAFYGGDNWPLVIGTVFNVLGIMLLGFSYNIISWRTLRYARYVLPLALVYIGVLLLLRVIRRRANDS